MSMDCIVGKTFEDMAFEVMPSGILVEITREYQESGRVSPDKLAQVLGDPTKSATMGSESDSAEHFRVKL